MFQPDLLAKKRILITGGGTGLGKGMARRFLELGASVYICGRRAEVLSAADAELQPLGTISAMSVTSPRWKLSSIPSGTTDPSTG